MLGANGAGKTTTLRAISGTVRRSGEIVFAGKTLARRPRGRRRGSAIAHVPEGRGTFTELAVLENLRLGAYVRRDRAAVKADVERVISATSRGSRSACSQHAGTLSGGEQQMLALARALMGRPRLLLLDEPSLGLAPLIVREIFRIVRELNEKEGLTVLVVEQNAKIALDARRARVRARGRAKVAVERGRAPELRAATSPCGRATWGTDDAGSPSPSASSGSRSSPASPRARIYAALALALVLIHRRRASSTSRRARWRCSRRTSPGR